MSKGVDIYIDNKKSDKKLELSNIPDNANSILNAIKDKVLNLKVDHTLTPNMVLDKVVVIPKAVEMPEPGFFDYFKSKPKSEPDLIEPVDLIKLSEMVGPDNLQKLSVEPTVDVYFKTPLGGRRSRRSRKSRKSRRR